MALARWTGVVQDAHGSAVPDAIVEVRSEQTGGLAQLFSNAAGTAALSNPFASASPTVWFHVAGGSYRIKATVGSFEQEWRYVSIGTAGELDIESLRQEIAATIAASLSQFKWFSKGIGEYYAADDGLPGVDIPPQDPALGQGVWIDLTAGLTGSGLYNNGKLSGEVVDGVAPLVSARAVVSYSQSPMAGQIVRLLNTERRMLRPGSAGVLQDDQMQQITGTLDLLDRSAYGTINVGTNGAFNAREAVSGSTATANGPGSRYRYADFNSANSPNARAGAETRAKNQGVRIFRRIG